MNATASTGTGTQPAAPARNTRKLVGRVRAGRALRPDRWKDDARCAVALSFDSDHETNELRDGGTSIGRLCWGQYGSRVGVPRILEVLERHGVRASFRSMAIESSRLPRRASCLRDP